MSELANRSRCSARDFQLIAVQRGTEEPCRDYIADLFPSSFLAAKGGAIGGFPMGSPISNAGEKAGSPEIGLSIVPRRGGAAGRNKLLRSIPERELAVISLIAEEVALKPRQVLHHWRLPMDHVYFVASALVSVSAKVDEARFVEAWLIGSEGMVGAPYVLAPADASPAHRRVVQVGGAALRVPAPAFVAAIQDLPVLRELILRYLNVVLFQTSQCGACNSLHSVKQRLARWLLMGTSALDSAELPLTHSVLAQLLGIRRASVSECLEVLENEGVIQNGRAAINITDRALLQRNACSCFGLVQREYDRQIGNLQPSNELLASPTATTVAKTSRSASPTKPTQTR